MTIPDYKSSPVPEPPEPKNKFNWKNFTYGFILTFGILAFLNIPFSFTAQDGGKPPFGFPFAYIPADRTFHLDALFGDLLIMIVAGVFVGRIMGKQKISLNPLNRGR